MKSVEQPTNLCSGAGAKRASTRVDGGGLGGGTPSLAASEDQAGFPAGYEDGSEAVNDLVRTARILDAAGQSPGKPEPLLRLGQRDHTAVRRQRPAVETGDHGLVVHGWQTLERQRRIGHGGCGLQRMTRIGFNTQILFDFNGLRYIRHPAIPP